MALLDGEDYEGEFARWHFDKSVETVFGSDGFNEADLKKQQDSINAITSWMSLNGFPLYGPCFSCRMENISYRYSPVHFEMGVRSSHWDDGIEICKPWANPEEYSSPFIVGIVGYYDWKPFLCKRCYELLGSLPDTRTWSEGAGFSTEQVVSRAELDSMVHAYIIGDIEEIRNTYTGADYERLRYMKYDQFRETDYWNRVRKYARLLNNNRCSLGCVSPYLQAHHKVYDHRGSEVNHMEDLIVLCSECHRKFHKNLPPQEG